MGQREPDYVVNLGARDDTNTLYYRVSVTDAQDVPVEGFIHDTENYNEALIYAKVFFDELAKNSSVVVASYIEQPGRLAKQGALYSVGAFAKASDIVSDEEFYDALSQEFFEHCRREEKADVNVAFRKIVNKHKLDLYKEGKFLGYLQKLGILEKQEGDDEFWIEEV